MGTRCKASALPRWLGSLRLPHSPQPRRRNRLQTINQGVGPFYSIGVGPFYVVKATLLLGRLFPSFLHSATYLLGGFVRCRLFSERHTLQTLKAGGFNQWLPTTTQNPQRNSGSEPSRRPFGKTRSAGSPITASLFSGSTPRGASGRPRRASVSSTCSPLPSSPIRRTRSSPSVKSRRPRRLATTKPAKRRTFRRRVKPRRLFSGRLSRREHGLSFRRRAVRGVSAGTLYVLGRERPAQRNQRQLFQFHRYTITVVV